MIRLPDFSWQQRKFSGGANQAGMVEACPYAFIASSLLLVALTGLAGCGGSNQTASTNVSAPETATANNEKQKDDATAAAAKAAEDRGRQEKEAAERLALLQKARENAKSEQWDELAETLEALRGKQASTDSASPPTDASADKTAATPASPDTQEIAELDLLLRQGRKQAAEKARQEQLAKAQALVAAGRLDDAQQSLREVLTRGPTDEQRETAQTLTQEIERLRKARRQLKSWLSMLATGEERDVQAAQTQLMQDPDTATGMLLESLRGVTSEKPALAYLDTLKQLGRSEVVVPAVLDILKDQEKKELWPLLTRELPQLAGPSAGQAILDLAIQTNDPSQRNAALETLATSADPPASAFSTLLPRLESDAEARPAILRVMTQCAIRHGQRDLCALRGLADSPELETLLATLPERLKSWYAKPPAAPTPPTATPTTPEAKGASLEAELAWEARRLAAVLAIEPGAPLTGLKVERAEAEIPESPAAAVLDGVWNSVDPKTQWRYPVDKKGSILLDLGQERLVTAVRIWNWNEPSGAQRGWKEVEVFVSSTPAELQPSATALVLPAPGVADSPDYGVQIPIPAVKGRYVRLQAKSQWVAESHSGLAEVQVIGF